MAISTKSLWDIRSGSNSQLRLKKTNNYLLSLNGEGDFFTFPETSASADWGSSKEFTFFGRFAQEKNVAGAVIAAQRDLNTGNARWDLRVHLYNTGAIYAGITAGAHSNAISAVTNDGVWVANSGAVNSVALVFSGNGATNADRMQIYINGDNCSLVFSGTIPSTLATSSFAPLRIGILSGNMGGLNFWNGAFGDIFYTASSMTSNQVKNLHEGFIPDKKWFFSCNEDSGSHVWNEAKTAKGIPHLISGSSSCGFIVRDWQGAPLEVPKPVKIMPWGDSNTEGSGYVGAYRVELHNRLVNHRIGFKFVGGRSNGPPFLNETNHEGRSGCKLSQMIITASSTVSGHINSTDDAILIIKCFTNDVTDSPMVSGSQGADMLESIVSSSFAVRPNIKILLCSVGERFGVFSSSIYSVEINDFRNRIPGIVDRWQAQKYKIDWCDTYQAAMIEQQMQSDGVHLNYHGFGVEGKMIFESLLRAGFITKYEK